jgi:urea carboxylase-associated protein 2
MANDRSTDTATPGAARAHARAQAGSTPSPVTIPSTAATDLPEGVRAADVIWDEVLAAGSYASRSLPDGAVLRLTDLEGDACAQLLVLSATNPAERLNVADTVKVQWQAYLTEGSVLLSDMGRAMMTLVADGDARVDCLCGGSTGPANAARYGEGSPSGPAPAARDLLVLGAMKLGLDRRDVGPNINLFARARVAADGSLHLDGAPAPGASVELRCEMALHAVVSNTPHPLDDRATYTATPLRITAWRAARPTVDPWRSTTPERERAHQNTDELRRALA